MKKVIVLLFMSFIVLGMNAQVNDLTKKKTDTENVETSVTKKEVAPLYRTEFSYEYRKHKVALPLQNKHKQIVVNTIGESFIGTSSRLEVGKCYYLFTVAEAEDTALIGKRVACEVIERRKSNISGSEGRLRLRPLYVENGTQQIPLVPNEIYRRGLNKTNAKFWLSFLVIPLFVPGTGAIIRPEEMIVMTLAD